MPEELTFQQLLAKIDEVCEIMADTHERTRDSEEKKVLGEMLGTVKSSRQEAESAMGNAVEALRKDLDQTQTELDEFQRQAAEAQAQLDQAIAEARNASPAATTVLEPEIDGDLGLTLRKELLGEFASKPKTERTDPPGRSEIWHDWE